MSNPFIVMVRVRPLVIAPTISEQLLVSAIEFLGGGNNRPVHLSEVHELWREANIPFTNIVLEEMAAVISRLVARGVVITTLQGYRLPVSVEGAQNAARIPTDH